MSLDLSRFRRRTWNEKKSHLPKYISLPDLHLLPPGRPLFQCGECGFINKAIPLCFWCKWTSEEARKEFVLSMPRPRCASAPGFQVELLPSQGKGPKNIPNPFNSPFNSSPNRKLQTFTADTDVNEAKKTTRFLISHNDGRRQRPISFVGRHTTPEFASAVIDIPATELVVNATHEVPPWVSLVDHTRSVLQRDRRPSDITLSTDASDFRSPLPSEEHSPPCVDRRSWGQHMSSPKLARILKASKRQPLSLELNNSKTRSPSLDLYTQTTLINNYERSKQSQQKPTLRRKKNFNTTTSTEGQDLQPITISLKLHSPPLQRVQEVQSSPATPIVPHAHISPRPISDSQSSSSSFPPSPRFEPPPSSPTSSTLPASPVRLGHPSRPYYTAIRKNGITSPSSIISTESQTPTKPRPQSYTPPSTYQTPSSVTSRHLSMSAMFVSPAYSPSPAGPLSAFIVDDIYDDDLENDNTLPSITLHSPSSNFVSSSENRRISTGFNTANSQSLSQAMSSGSIGFSMSGEIELKMALASGAASDGFDEGHYRFQETALRTLPSTTQEKEGMEITPNNFVNRLRKLRKGLKGLFS